MIAGTPARVSAQPSWRSTKASASSSGSSRRPALGDGPSITSRAPAGRGRSSRPARRRVDGDGVDVDRGDDRASGTGGWAAKYSAPSRPTSSAVVARNKMSRCGRGSRPRRPAISIRVAMPLALSTAPLQIRSGAPSGRQVPKWSQWPRKSRLSPLLPLPRIRPMTLLRSIRRDRGRDLEAGAERQRQRRGRTSRARSLSSRRDCRRRPGEQALGRVLRHRSGERRAGRAAIRAFCPAS